MKYIDTEKITITMEEFDEAPGCGSSAVTSAIRKKLGCDVMVIDYHWNPKMTSLEATYQRKKPHERKTFKR